MDAVIQQSIQLVRVKARNEVPWDFDQPTENGTWQANHPSKSAAPSDSAGHTTNIVKSLVLYSWNIDFMLPFSTSRMRAALRHLENLISQDSDSKASVIFLSECLHTDLELIASDPWVRRTFHVTDLDGTYWQPGLYGTIMLVDRRLAISGCFRVHYSQTRMERDMLCVDVGLGGKGEVGRLCNTHLESLVADPPLRQPQMKICAEFMHDSALKGAVSAGDLNAIQEFDRILHSDHGLKGAFLELGGRDGDGEGGHTWGQQAARAQRERFGTCRMDKVFFCGGVECKGFERFGAGVEVEDGEERERIVGLGFERPWITDHLGVKVEVFVAE